MQFHSFLFPVALLCITTIAAPAPSLRDSIEHVEARSLLPGPMNPGKLAVIAALNKYGWSADSNIGTNSQNQDKGPAPAPASQNAAETNTGTGASGTQATPSSPPAPSGGSVQSAVYVTSENNSMAYTSPVLVGGQQLSLLIDTGSTDLWVLTPSTAMNASTPPHSFYDPSKSSAFSTLSGETFDDSYGDSSLVHGTVGTDTVNVGGAVVNGQAFGLATQVSSHLQQTSGEDGILGLGFSPVSKFSPTPQKGFFENIMPSLRTKVFTADLHSQGQGVYGFGYIDDAKYQGSLSYAPVTGTDGYWEVNSTQISVGSQVLMTASQSTFADTGTSVIMMNNDVAAGYYQQVQGSSYVDSAGGYIFPCTATLPDLNINLGGQGNAKVPGALLNYQPLTDGNCYGGVQGNHNGTKQVLGIPFFKANFVVFDAGQMRLGFAPHSSSDVIPTS